MHSIQHATNISQVDDGGENGAVEKWESEKWETELDPCRRKKTHEPPSHKPPCNIIRALFPFSGWFFFKVNALKL